jgi:hypothetical protein
MTDCKHNWQFTEGGTGTLLCTRCGAVTGPRTPEQLTQDMLQDVLTIGSAWSKGGERIDPLSVYRDFEPSFKLHDSRPANTIQFYGGPEPRTEVLRISKDGIWANPDVPCDEAAKKVLEAIDGYVKGMVERALEDDTGVSWGVDWGRAGDKSCVSIIKRLPNGKIKVLAVEYQP